MGRVRLLLVRTSTLADILTSHGVGRSDRSHNSPPGDQYRWSLTLIGMCAADSGGAHEIFDLEKLKSPPLRMTVIGKQTNVLGKVILFYTYNPPVVVYG